MNGLDFLDKIMRLRPTPVIMVSSLTAGAPAAAIAALEIGAFDCVGKPGWRGVTNSRAIAGQRQGGGRTAHGAASPLGSGERARSAGAAPPIAANGRLVAIGASTGGVEAIIAMLSLFPQNCPPTRRHSTYAGGVHANFAERLDRLAGQK